MSVPHISIGDIDAVLPFHLILDTDLSIASAGSALMKIVPDIRIGEPFTDRFTIDRPHHEVSTCEAIRQIGDRLVLVRPANHSVQLRGCFHELEIGDGFLFSSSPLMNKAEDIERLGLLITDFAAHDPITDFLFALRARDVTLDELRGAIKKQRLLTQELDHRVKNTLSAILALVSLTKGDTQHVEQFTEQLEGRVHAMAMSHELLATTGWKQVDLSTLITTVLGGFCQGSVNLLEINGPKTTIDTHQAGPLSMAIHEMGINALKYGAWSNNSGSVSIGWTVEDDMIHILWTETGGPPIASEPMQGVGNGLINGFIKYELRGAIDMDFRKDGLVTTIDIPRSADS